MAGCDGRGSGLAATATAGASAGSRLVSALSAARQAFAAGDPFGASTALDAVLAACAELERSGKPLDPATLAEARAVHGACTAAATPLRDELRARMEHAAGARRAANAYAR